MKRFVISVHRVDPSEIVTLSAPSETLSRFIAEDELSQGAEYVAITAPDGTVTSWGKPAAK